MFVCRLEFLGIHRIHIVPCFGRITLGLYRHYLRLHPFTVLVDSVKAIRYKFQLVVEVR